MPAGFLFAAVFLYFARPTLIWWCAGAAVAALGLALRTWAAGYLEKWQRLAVSGPYRHTRNPLYLGSFLMGAGFGLASGRLWLLGAFVVLFAVIYIPVMRREEGELRQAYAGDFESYRQQVPLFFPWPGAQFRGLERGPGNFLWERVISNREYRAAIGYLAVLAALLVKVIWF